MFPDLPPWVPPAALSWFGFVVALEGGVALAAGATGVGLWISLVIGLLLFAISLRDLRRDEPELSATTSKPVRYVSVVAVVLYTVAVLAQFV